MKLDNGAQFLFNDGAVSAVAVAEPVPLRSLGFHRSHARIRG